MDMKRFPNGKKDVEEQEGFLEKADLSWAKLEGADLSWAKLEGADLYGAKLEGATMPDGTIHD